VEVVLLVNDAPAPLFRRLDGRMFAAVTPGSQAKLSVRNVNQNSRVELIVSFDGMNLLTDQEPASETSDHSFVLRGGQTYVFDGWRVDDSTTRQIIFGSPDDSIAAKAEVGDVSNVGVIGVVTYQEMGNTAFKADYHDPVFRGYGADRVTRGAVSMGGGFERSASKGMASDDMYGAGSVGAGIGAEQYSQVGRTTFTRSGQPDRVVIGYDTMAELERRGILTPPDPDPFPGARTGYGAYTS
jgi:hypothetical protein